MAEEKRVATGSQGNNVGPYLAKVISHLDPNYMGSLEVQLEHEVGNDPAKEGQLHIVRYMSPFAGQTSVDFAVDGETYDDTQKSYGFWMVPPDVGSTVVVFFIEGDPRKGLWVGCVRDENMNFMVPGIAASSFVVDGIEERVPVAEYNKKAIPVGNSDSSKNRKPQHPLANILKEQGLIKDDTRGITTSSARREVPSSVFGISTPGPLDKRQNSPKASIGKAEHKVPGAPISRLGGTTFVMDDGDDKFIRKTRPSEGPPEYASVEQDDIDGDRTLLHNELVRIRTRTGHQLLFHNSEDLIYIGNARGTSWIELSSDGKIDIYAEDSISIHTKQDFNFYADRDINLEAGRNINIKANNEMHTEVVSNYSLIIGADGKIATVGNYNINTAGNNRFTAAGNTDIKSVGNHNEQATEIHMNGPAPEIAEQPTFLNVNTLPKQVTDQTTNEQPNPWAGKDSEKAAAWAKLTPEDQAWLGNADPTDPFILRRAPNKGAARVQQPTTEDEPLKSIMRRIPMHEPWPHHENLDPQEFKSEKTDRDFGDRFSEETPNAEIKEEGEEEEEEEVVEEEVVEEKNPLPTADEIEYFKKYTTSVDTFAKVKGTEG
jgi:hypothetical protein